MNRLFIIFFSAILFVTSSKAEIVNQININGNKRVSDETIKVYGQVKPKGSNYTNFDLDNILKNLYETNFFEEVSVEIKNKQLIINLREYPIVNQLTIIGERNSKIREQLVKVISTKDKNSFIKNNLNNDISIIKQLYASLGYNFAEIDFKTKKLNEGNYDVVLEIERGELTKIAKIFFSGDKKIKEKRLRDIIASEEDKFWKVISRNTNFKENQIALDKRLLLNYYKSIGYYDVEISSSSAEILNSGNVNLYYTINAGQRYIISKIETIVDSTFDKNLFFPLKKSYEKLSGEYYSPFKIKKILDDIDRLIENNNLQFVEHNVNEIIDDGKIQLKFNIFEGEKILIERVNIEGNQVTDESVIRSELLVDEGDPFSNLNLEKSVSNLKSRNLFQTVKKSVSQGSSPDLKIIDIIVEEKATGEISAGAGIGTDGGSFAINIKENNWLGKGNKVGFELELSKESIKGEISYANPNYDLLGNTLQFSAANSTNDKPEQGYKNNVLEAGVGTSFEQFKDVYTNVGLNLVYDDLTTNSSASDALKKQSGQFTELGMRYGFSYDQRNRSFMPTDGSIIRFSQGFPLYADKPFISNTVSSSNYHSFNENVIGAGKIFLSTINGLDDEDVRISKRRNLSTRRLRGFQKGKVGPVDGTDHVGGNYAAALNLEASLPNLLPENTNTDIALFLDFGNVWKVDYDKTIDDSNKLRSTTGLAANWLSPIGPLSFTLATNIAKANTDITESFNFNLGTSF